MILVSYTCTYIFFFANGGYYCAVNNLFISILFLLLYIIPKKFYAKINSNSNPQPPLTIQNQTLPFSLHICSLKLLKH